VVVIVSCPSCRTRYRHAETGAAANLRARCSYCDEVFALVPRRSYLLAPRLRAVPVGVPAGDMRMTIGMDDPMLADRLRSTTLDAGASPRALTYRVVAEPDASGSAAPQVGPADRVAGDSPDREIAVPYAAGRGPRAGDRPVWRPSHPLREMIGSLLLSALGVCGGYQAALLLQEKPLLWMSGGAVAGLLLGWTWIRCVARRQ
jgi:predicted Zn finger-like uncharacterized protein